MTFNSPAIIQDIRSQFEQMLDFVTGEQSRTATADHIERGLFKMLLSMGAKLLQLFFVIRSQACTRQVTQTETGEELPYYRDTPREYFSIFGKVTIERPYFYKQGVGGKTPLDEELSLGTDSYSDLLREVSEYLGVYTVYGKTSDILERLLEINLSTRALQENVAEDASDFEAYYAQKPPPAVESEAEILVIQADGKGIPMILEESEESTEPNVRLGKGQKRGHKKEAIVTSVYTIGANLRTPEQVVASFFELPQDPQLPAQLHPEPQNKYIWATLDGKETALSRLSVQVAQRLGAHIQYQVALCDGCEALQSRITTQFPDFSLVLDFIHASEYLWDVVNRLLGEEHPQRESWMAEQTLRILSGQTQQVIADFRHMAQDSDTKTALREQLNKTANYFERNLPFMDYPTYLSRGWPIASGVIEGACRHFVKDRCELSGMRWNQSGAENLLRLRAVAENGDWDAYHSYRKLQRHIRLYTLPETNPQAIESQVLNFQPTISRKRMSHQELPLAA